MNSETPLIDIRPDHWAIVHAILQKHVPHYEVWAFGSRATWKAKEFSDLDLAIISDKPLSLDVSASLSEDLSESDLPWKVDVVDWASTSASFRTIIERDKVVLQEAKRELGMVNEWKSSTVGEFCPFIYGKALPERSRILGMFPVISSAGVSGSHNEPLVTTAGIVIGRKGTVGSVTLSKSAFWPIDTAFYIADEPQRDLRFTYYLLKTLGLHHMNSDSAVPGLNRDNVHALKIFVPGLQEQRDIAHILGTLDDKIELNRKQNETLEVMARTLFKAWFVDFEPVRAKIEGRWQRGQSLPGLPAHLYDLFPDRFVDSELGEIPEGWSVEELSTHLDVLESGRRPKGGVGGISKGVPSVGAESISGVGQFEFGKTKYVSEEFFAAMKSGHAESMDVMLYKDGGKPGDFRPRVSMFGRGFPFERYAINEHVFRMRSKSLGQIFLYLQVSHERILFDLRNRGGKAAIPGINQSDVKTLLLVVPRREVLAVFDKVVLPMMEGILERALEGRSLAQLRDTLLPKLVSGELRVPDAERFLGAVEKA